MNKHIIKRAEYLESLIHLKDTNLIKVVTGIRRCGKSTLLELFQDYLKKNGVVVKQIIAVNLEDGAFRGIQTAEALYDHVETRLVQGKTNYVFLDEVQQVSEFQRAVDWLYAKKGVDLYITGSNAFLLSGELATLLSGRYVEIKMQPLSFKEYVSAHADTSNLPMLYRDYVQESSFPGTLELSRKQDIRAYLDGIYNTILMKDIVTRNSIADPSLLQRVVEFLFDNIGNLSSSTSIANTLTSAGCKISVPTVESYLSALRDSFILYKTGRYDVKGKQYLSRGFKYYVADIGLRYTLLGTKQADMGHILENVVYLELLRRGYEVHIGKVGKAEVDFIAINSETTEYYQVAYSVMDQNTLQRELAPLNAIHDHNPKYLITMDYVPSVSYNGIKQVQALEWLLRT